MNSSMFVNCSVFFYVRSSVLDKNVMFGSVRSSVLLLRDQTSLGTNSLMFANCSVFCDVRHFRSSILGHNLMFRKFDVWTLICWKFGILLFVPRLILAFPKMYFFQIFKARCAHCCTTDTSNVFFSL